MSQTKSPNILFKLFFTICVLIGLQDWNTAFVGQAGWRFLKICLFYRQSNRERDRETSSIHWFTLQLATWLGLFHAKWVPGAQILEPFSAVFPSTWTTLLLPSYFMYTLYPFTNHKYSQPSVSTDSTSMCSTNCGWKIFFNLYWIWARISFLSLFPKHGSITAI